MGLAKWSAPFFFIYGKCRYYFANLISVLNRIRIYYFGTRQEAITVVTLDRNDPFESALIHIVEINRRKRADYGRDGEPFSNFKATARSFGMQPEEAALFNVAQKLERILTLRANNRKPENEAVIDSYLDLAVYGVIAYAILKQRARPWESMPTSILTTETVDAPVVVTDEKVEPDTAND